MCCGAAGGWGSGSVRRAQPREKSVKNAKGRGTSKCKVPEPERSLACMRKKKKINVAAV